MSKIAAIVLPFVEWGIKFGVSVAIKQKRGRKIVNEARLGWNNVVEGIEEEDDALVIHGHARILGAARELLRGRKEGSDNDRHPLDEALR